MNRPSYTELRRVAQPDAVLGRRNAEHWVSLLYGRKASLRITRLLIGTRATANGVTVAMILVGLAATAALLIDSLLGSILCAVGIQIYLVLDCTDGELARWTKTTSARGVYLDRLGHYVVEAALFTAYGARVGDSFGSGWLSVGLATALLAVLTKAETDLVASSAGPGSVDRTSAKISEPRRPVIRVARAFVYPLRVHRATGAVEASLLIVVATVVEGFDVGHTERLLAVGFFTISAALSLGHLLAILSSRRLDEGGT